MKCIEAKSKIWFFLEDDLNESETQLLTQHFFSCQDCQKEVDFLFKMVKIIDEEKVRSNNPFFVEKVVNQVVITKQNSQINHLLHSIFRTTKPAFAAFAVLGCIALGVFLGTPNTSHNNDDVFLNFSKSFGIELEIENLPFD
jgi:hypothetical protein